MWPTTSVRDRRTVWWTESTGTAASSAGSRSAWHWGCLEMVSSNSQIGMFLSTRIKDQTQRFVWLAACLSLLAEAEYYLLNMWASRLSRLSALQDRPLLPSTTQHQVIRWSDQARPASYWLVVLITMIQQSPPPPPPPPPCFSNDRLYSNSSYKTDFTKLSFHILSPSWTGQFYFISEMPSVCQASSQSVVFPCKNNLDN